MSTDLKLITKNLHETFIKGRAPQVGEAAAMIESSLLSLIGKLEEGPVATDQIHACLETLLEYLVAINSSHAIIAEELDELRIRMSQ